MVVVVPASTDLDEATRDRVHVAVGLEAASRVPLVADPLVPVARSHRPISTVRRSPQVSCIVSIFGPLAGWCTAQMMYREALTSQAGAPIVATPQISGTAYGRETA